MSDWEPFGEPGMGGYQWGEKSDGSMGMVPGGVQFDASGATMMTDVGGSRLASVQRLKKPWVPMWLWRLLSYEKATFVVKMKEQG